MTAANVSPLPASPVLRGTPNLTKALIEAKKEMKPIIKTGFNPHFRSHFADLSNVNDAVDDALGAHGLVVTQLVNIDEGGPMLATKLLHVSGEELVSFYPLVPTKDRDPQALGACITYARRYSKMAILGLAPEDDDGETASGRPQAEKSGGQNFPAQTPHEPRTGEVREPPKGVSPANATKPASEKQRKMIWALVKKKGIEIPAFKRGLKEHFETEDVDALSMGQASEAIERLQKLSDAEAQS